MSKGEAGVRRIKIQSGMCQVRCGLPHSKGDVVKLEMPNWLGETRGLVGSRCRWRPQRDVRRELWRCLQGAVTIGGWGKEDGTGSRQSSSQSVGGKRKNTVPLKLWQLSSWKDVMDSKVRCSTAREIRAGLA